MALMKPYTPNTLRILSTPGHTKRYIPSSRTRVGSSEWLSSEIPATSRTTEYTLGYLSLRDQTTERAHKHIELLFHLSVDLFILIRRTFDNQGHTSQIILTKL